MWRGYRGDEPKEPVFSSATNQAESTIISLLQETSSISPKRKTRGMETSSLTSFDNLLQIAVHDSLSKILGENTWEALAFYFDFKKVESHPDLFERTLTSLFGQNRSREIQKLIIETILINVGGPRVPVVEGKRLDDFYAAATTANPGFQDWIRRAKAHFTSHGYNPG